MLKTFLLYVVLLAASVVGAQRLPTTPDLTTRTQNAGAKLEVDSPSGRIFASGFSSGALGVPFAGLARVGPGGLPDVNWRPTELTYTFSHVMGTNGDVYVLGRQDVGVIQLVRYSATRSYVGFQSALHAITPKYLYFVYKKKDDTGAILVRRALLSGNGVADPDWLMRPIANAGGVLDQILSLVTQTANPRSDDIEYLLSQRDAAFRYAGSALATRSNARAAAKTVVEYFNRDAGRYFITGPASEQVTLNALLALFQPKAANTRCAGAARMGFYAAPESGGSNTHFYGTGDDVPR